MRRSNKHQSQRVPLAPLSGGINVSIPAEQLDNTEATVLQNFVYDVDSARLIGRGGLQNISQFQSDIIGMYYDIESNTTFVFLADRSVWQIVASSGTVTQKRNIGMLNGDKAPSCEKFKNKIYFASGSNLQFWDYDPTHTITTLTQAPVCDMLFYRWGRLAACQSGLDRITYSSTGDASSDVAWEENTNDDSSMKWLDVGDSDDGDIWCVVPLKTDMIVFKTNGKVYQLVGDADYNSWAVYNVSNYTDLTKAMKAGRCATNIGDEVVFLSLRGLKTLTATQDYGNIATTDIGAKFNRLITKSMYEPELINMRRHRTILIRPTADTSYFVAYNYGMNAATTLKFGLDISAICETKDDVFVASGTDLFLWTDKATMDYNTPIEYIIKPKTLISAEDILVKSIDTKFSSDHAGTATFEIGDRLKVDMPTNHRRKVKCNHSDDVIEVTITSTSRFEVDHIALETVDL